MNTGTIYLPVSICNVFYFTSMCICHVIIQMHKLYECILGDLFCGFCCLTQVNVSMKIQDISDHLQLLLLLLKY